MMRIEMQAIARMGPFTAGDQIPTWIFITVAWRAFCADQLGFKSKLAEALIQKITDIAITCTGWVQCRDADQSLGQGDYIIAGVFDTG